MFMISFTMMAQQPVTPDYSKDLTQIKFGLKGGVNFSTQNFGSEINGSSLDLNSTSLTAAHFGLFAEVPISEKLMFKPEALYSVEGSDINIFVTQFQQKFTFIKVPLLASYRIGNNLSLQGGPQFGFLIDETLDVEDDSVDILDSSFKKFEFSMAIGLEYDLSESLLLGARYNIGVSDISNTQEASLRTNNLQVYVGWRLFK